MSFLFIYFTTYCNQYFNISLLSDQEFMWIQIWIFMQTWTFQTVWMYINKISIALYIINESHYKVLPNLAHQGKTRHIVHGNI